MVKNNYEENELYAFGELFYKDNWQKGTDLFKRKSSSVNTSLSFEWKF